MKCCSQTKNNQLFNISSIFVYKERLTDSRGDTPNPIALPYINSGDTNGYEPLN